MTAYGDIHSQNDEQRSEYHPMMSLKKGLMGGVVGNERTATWGEAELITPPDDEFKEVTNWWCCGK